MTRFGYTLMTEQSGPRELVTHAVSAERAGFDFEVMSDHYNPWLHEQGHAPYAWSVLGAVAHATSSIDLMTYVTCPTMRYHPAVVAQKAATVGLLAQDRFTLGLGSGENLNEHVVGQGWPMAEERHGRLVEAMEIIGALLDGDEIDYDGEYYRVEAARLWDLPEVRVPVAAAVSGRRSVEAFSPLADALVAVEPNADLVSMWDESRDGPSRKIGQIPICWGPDADAAVETAHAQFRWFAGGWEVNSMLPMPSSFGAGTAFVRPEDVAKNIACGPDIDKIVESVAPFWEAGFTDVALVQVGEDSQEEFLRVAESDLLPALRSAAPTDRA